MIHEPTIFLCPPTYFRVESTINIWMKKTKDPVNRKKAQQQWDILKNTFETYISVETIEPQPELPDMVFTANSGFIYNNNVILSTFLYKERKKEAYYFQQKFLSLDYTVHTVPDAYTFEGCGDALYDEYYNIVWAGYGFRSDKEVYPFIEEHTGIQPIYMQLVQESFYHLDTCLCPLAHGYMLYYPKALSDTSLKTLEDIVPKEKRIPVSDEDAFSFACNATAINNTIILNTVSQTLVQTLQEQGMHIHQVPLDEFLKSGGTAKCLSLRLDTPSLLSS